MFLKITPKRLKSQVTTLATSYYWDGVPFVKGSGIKYPHPDYNSYPGWEVWETWKIPGNNLNHWHMSDTWSGPIAELSPAVAGAIIGSRAGAQAAVAGAVLGLLLGGVTSGALLDEEGCIWYWYSYSWKWIVLPIPPYLHYIPKYFRISEYTLWDEMSMGNP